MEKQFVTDLKDRDQVQSVFVAQAKNVQVGKNGKQYISMSLCDVSGAIDARVWDNIDHISRVFDTGDFVKVKGQVQIFQNRKQLIVHGIEKASSSEVDLKSLVKVSARDLDEMYSELLQIVKEIEDDKIRELTLNIIQNPEIKPKLMRCPAAKTIHHAYVGGLIEHILSICGTMNFLASHYPVLRKDLLIFGAIFHDLGKIWELDIEGGIHYTDAGRLVGHLVLSSELIEKTASQILGFPEDLKNILKHLVLSHHGRLEYGSPKRPKFLEAFVVAAIDDFDSKMNTLSTFMQGEKRGGQKWSRYYPEYDRYFYLGLLPESETEPGQEESQ